MVALTRQEIFNNAYRGLASQDWKRAYDAGTGNCRFRINGLKCAVGWSIPDGTYQSHMEYESPRYVLLSAGVELAPDVTNDFLRSLQVAHDQSESWNIKERLENFAEIYGLTIPELSKLEEKK